ncbi:cell division protein ZapA [Haloimpatiens sp. FM7315]|uniref:cell division protein ZapA n=1 Tax=Haloimpatiens sp. FM7315 TaxID=3298609 RepID=UPI00370A443D
MNTITFKVNGLEYNLKGEENEEYLQKVANYVDKKMQNLMENNEKLSISAAAVLTALNSVDEMFKAKKERNSLVEEVKQYDNNKVHVNEQLEYLKKQVKHLEEYNLELQNRLKSGVAQESLNKKDQTIENLNDQISILEESAKSYLEDKNRYQSQNRELKFQVHSIKYKAIDLENRLMENQIDLAKTKKKLATFEKSKK